MTRSSPTLPLSLAIALGTMLAGCSAAEPDPASEAPVELAAGEYKVDFSGQAPTALGMMKTDAPTGMKDKICLAAPDDDKKVAKLARTYLSMHEQCEHEGGERVGNAVSGAVSCMTDPERMPGGSMGQEYTGKLTADSIRLEGKMVLDLPYSSMTAEQEKAMKDYAEMTKDIRIVVEATRIGDCS